MKSRKALEIILSGAITSRRWMKSSTLVALLQRCQKKNIGIGVRKSFMCNCIILIVCTHGTSHCMDVKLGLYEMLTDKPYRYSSCSAIGNGWIR